MEIKYNKDFLKNFQKLTPKIKLKVFEGLKEFSNNPFNPKFKNHSLRGELESKRAFSIGGDLRIIFQEYNNYEYIVVLGVGTHNQLY